MSATTDAWQQLYEAQTEAVGAEIYATVGIRTGRAVRTELTLDEILAAGGLAEGGGYTLQMLLSEMQFEPAKFSPVKMQGARDLVVLGVNSNNGILYIRAGDPVANEGR